MGGGGNCQNAGVEAIAETIEQEVDELPVGVVAEGVGEGWDLDGGFEVAVY